MNLNNLLNTETGKQLVKTYHSEQHENRCKMIAEIDNLKHQRNDELKPLNRALDQAAADCVEAQSKLEAAKIRERTADSKVRQAKGVYSSQLTRIQKEILASAPECINDFILEIKQDMDDLRNTGITRSLKQSNTISFNARLQAMREATTEAEKLKLLAVPDIDSMLHQLRDSIPALVMQ